MDENTDPGDWIDPNDWVNPEQPVKVAASLEGAASAVKEPPIWEDIAKTIGISPVKGPIHALGTPGDVKSLIDLGLEKVGVPKERREGALAGIAATPLGFMARGPTSAQVQKGVEQATGPLYESKTDWGRRVGTLANAATNPLSYVGPGSMAAKAILAETSAIGSEAAGAAAKGTALETPARIVGALAGGMTPAAIEASLRKTPKFGEFLKAGDQQYKDAHNLGIEFKPKAIFDLQRDINNKLQNAHFRDTTAPGAFSSVKELGTSLTGGSGYLTADLHNVKQTLKNISRGKIDEWPNGSPDYRAAQIVRKEIDKFLTANDPSKITRNAGALNDFVKFYTDANKNYGAGLNLQRIDKKLLEARRQSDASDALKPYNVQRQKIKQIVSSEGQKKWYTPEQQAQMDKIVQGTGTGNLGRFLGRWAPRGYISGGAPILAALATGQHWLPAATWGMGEAGRAVARSSNNRQIGKLQEMIREGAPAYPGLKPPPGTIRPQSRTPFPYANELSDLTGGEPAPNPAAKPKTIPREDQKEIRRALEIARQLQGVSRQSGGRVAGIDYTADELDASRREDRRYREFLGRVAPRGIPWQRFRRTSPSNIEDRSNEGYVSEEERNRRTTPVQNWSPISDLSRQAGYDDIKKARGGKVKKRIPPHVTIPEPPATLKKQQQSLIAGRRAAMLFPHKSSELPLPRGIRRMRTKDGLVHFDKRKLTPSQIRKASDEGRMNEVLEMGPVTKEEALARASKGEKLVAVTERGPDGVEAKSALGTEQTAPAQLAALQETADPGDWVSVEPVQETLARRAVA